MNLKNGREIVEETKEGIKEMSITNYRTSHVNSAIISIEEEWKVDKWFSPQRVVFFNKKWINWLSLFPVQKPSQTPKNNKLLYPSVIWSTFDIALNSSVNLRSSVPCVFPAGFWH